MQLAVSSSSREVATEPACLRTFKEEFDYLCRTMRRFGVPASDVEDLLQEVFIILHSRWADYDTSRPVRPWLFGISFRVASNHRRKSAREQPQPWLELEDCALQPEQALVSKQARALVLRSLQKVPLPRRAVLIMHDIDYVPMREVARILSVPLFTAYSRLRKARREFKAAVRKA